MFARLLPQRKPYLKIMPKVKIDKKRCKGCRLCVLFCPTHAIVMDEKLNEKGIFCAKPDLNKKCSGCGICYLMCPDACIEIESDT